MYKKIHIVFFSFFISCSFIFLLNECPGLCQLCLANFEAFLLDIKLSANLSFLKSAYRPWVLGDHRRQLKERKVKGRIVPASIDRKLVNNDDVPHGVAVDIFGPKKTIK